MWFVCMGTDTHGVFVNLSSEMVRLSPEKTSEKAVILIPKGREKNPHP